MFKIIFAQIFSCCQTWPFHIKDDSPKKSNIFGCFWMCGMFWVCTQTHSLGKYVLCQPSLWREMPRLENKKKMSDWNTFNYKKHIIDMYIFLCEKLFVSIIVVSISVKPLKSSRAKAIIHWISSLGALSDIFSPPYRILICTMEVK